MSKILAIDYGEKRMGIAVSDEGRSVAFPRDFIGTENFETLIDLIEKENIEEVLVGYPRALSGNKTESTTRVEEFVKKLTSRTDAPVWKIDERLTTEEVLKELQDMGQKYKDQKEMIDSFVAQKMLERYLEQLRK